MHIPTFRPAKLYSPDGYLQGDCLASDTVLENFIVEIIYQGAKKLVFHNRVRF